MTALQISNRDARALWLSVNGLAAAPTGPLDTYGVIRALGFVQIDSIQIVARAHHHILWSRNQNYREPMLDDLLAKDRLLFEHFTHDASVLPMEFLPMWQRQFQRMKDKVGSASWYGAVDAVLLEDVTQRIMEEGPLSTRSFDTKAEGEAKMWKRPPHKKALDFLWYSGVLSTSHRAGFIKHYDLAERIFPDHFRGQNLEDQDQIDWLCRAALERIGCGTLTEVRKFWDAVGAREVSDWAKRDAASLIDVEIEGADGTWSKAIATAEIEARLAALKAPASRVRILSPFDPAIRNRVRLKRLFGFEYTVEMFVPAAKREWGYYVFPVLQGDRFVGRIEAKADRSAGVLNVLNYWTEAGVAPSQDRAAKLQAELKRFAALADVGRVHWVCSEQSKL
jgi:uncharacterized protein YcaQ